MAGRPPNPSLPTATGKSGVCFKAKTSAGSVLHHRISPTREQWFPNGQIEPKLREIPAVSVQVRLSA